MNAPANLMERIEALEAWVEQLTDVRRDSEEFAEEFNARDPELLEYLRSEVSNLRGDVELAYRSLCETLDFLDVLHHLHNPKSLDCHATLSRGLGVR